jgi:LCP family protein required for cell wall assembly
MTYDARLFGRAGTPAGRRATASASPRDRNPQIAGRVAALLLLAGTAFSGGVVLRGMAGDEITRIPNAISTPAAPRAPASAAPAAAAAPITALLIGSDSRSDVQTTGADAAGPAGSQRSDSIMVVQLSPDLDRAVVVSIPRDSWVTVPGHGMHKINAAYAIGGAPLLVSTVQALTGLHIDHVGVIDFIAFARVTDDFGGVDVRVARDTEAFGVAFDEAGNHLNGEQALAYVRQRRDLPNGDLDRVRRHQSYLRSMIGRTEAALLVNPARLPEFIKAVTRTVSVDDSLSDAEILRLAVRLRNLRPERVAYLTAPIAAEGRLGNADVIYLDRRQGQQLWNWMRDGKLAEHLDAFPALPDLPF